MKQKFIVNAVVAIIAAFFAAMQEYWLGTKITFFVALAYGSVVGAVMSWATEIAKNVFSEWGWSWKDVIIGAIAGVVMSLCVATSICVG